MFKLLKIARYFRCWIFFRTKIDSITSSSLRKCRFVVRGDLDPLKGLYSPVFSIDVVRFILAVGLSRGYFSRQLDIRTAFLNAIVP